MRLQNAARMDVDADAPRVILFGDPTFHQFEQEWISYEVLSESDKARATIQGRDATGPVVIALELPNDMPVQYARAYGAEGQESSYMPGMSYFDLPLGRALSFDQPLSSALAFGRRTVLLEWPGGDGELTLYSTRPPGAVLRRVFSDGFVGIQAIFIDFFSMQGVELPLAIVSLIVLLITRSKRKPDTHTLWGGVFVGIGISLLGILYCLGLRFLIPWPIIVTVGCGATTVVWIVSPRWREWRRMALCAGLYIAPLTLVWLIGALIGASQRVLILVIWGTVLTGLVYGLMVWIVMTLLAKFLGISKLLRDQRETP